MSKTDLNVVASEAVTLAVIGDSHCNSTVGLCAPNSAAEDGGAYSPSRGQMWLWEQWYEYCAEVRRLARGSRLVVILNGDIVEADSKGRSWQKITENPETITENAYLAMKPVVQTAKHVFIVSGTIAHCGKSNHLQAALARAMGAKNAGAHLYAQFADVVVDVAHFARGSGLRGNAPMVRLAESTIVSYAGRGERIPDLVMRSHRHRYRDSLDCVPGCRAITLPAWSLHTEYVEQTMPEELADIGGLIVRCEQGNAQVTVWRADIPTRKPLAL